jgi:hypothetical protein
MQAGMPQGSVMSPTLYNLLTIGVNVPPFADGTCLYATEFKEGYILRKLQCGLV